MVYTQQVAICLNRVAKRVKHVSPNNVAICCAGKKCCHMLCSYVSILIVNCGGYIFFSVDQGITGPTGAKGESGSRGQEVCNENKTKKYEIKFSEMPNTSEICGKQLLRKYLFFS